MDNQTDNQELMLSTADNPFNPHDNYEQWLYFDTQQGYNTQSYIARVYQSKLEDEDNNEPIDELLNETFEEIMKINPLNLSYILI